ncbi:hypothetical protein PAMP_011338 [Pampus punctatissimus]
MEKVLSKAQQSSAGAGWTGLSPVQLYKCVHSSCACCFYIFLPPIPPPPVSRPGSPPPPHSPLFIFPSILYPLPETDRLARLFGGCGSLKFSSSVLCHQRARGAWTASSMVPISSPFPNFQPQ